MTPPRGRLGAALWIYTRVVAAHLGHRWIRSNSVDPAPHARAHAIVEDLLEWQILVVCTGWAVGALCTATGLALVLILDRPEWRVYGPLPGLAAAVIVSFMTVGGLLHLPSRLGSCLVAEDEPHVLLQTRPPPPPPPPPPPGTRGGRPLPSHPSPPPASTATTLRWAARRPAAPPREPASDSRLLPTHAGPATERARFTVHPGRPGHDGATQGVEPSWPYVV